MRPMQLAIFIFLFIAFAACEEEPKDVQGTSIEEQGFAALSEVGDNTNLKTKKRDSQDQAADPAEPYSPFYYTNNEEELSFRPTTVRYADTPEQGDDATQRSFAIQPKEEEAAPDESIYRGPYNPAYQRSEQPQEKSSLQEYAWPHRFSPPVTSPHPYAFVKPDYVREPVPQKLHQPLPQLQPQPVLVPAPHAVPAQNQHIQFIIPLPVSPVSPQQQQHHQHHQQQQQQQQQHQQTPTHIVQTYQPQPQQRQPQSPPPFVLLRLNENAEPLSREQQLPYRLNPYVGAPDPRQGYLIQFLQLPGRMLLAAAPANRRPHYQPVYQNYPAQPPIEYSGKPQQQQIILLQHPLPRQQPPQQVQLEETIVRIGNVKHNDRATQPHASVAPVSAPSGPPAASPHLHTQLPFLPSPGLPIVHYVQQTPALEQQQQHQQQQRQQRILPRPEYAPIIRLFAPKPVYAPQLPHPHQHFPVYPAPPQFSFAPAHHAPGIAPVKVRYTPPYGQQLLAPTAPAGEPNTAPVSYIQQPGAVQFGTHLVNPSSTTTRPAKGSAASNHQQKQQKQQQQLRPKQPPHGAGTRNTKSAK